MTKPPSDKAPEGFNSVHLMKRTTEEQKALDDQIKEFKAKHGTPLKYRNGKAVYPKASK
jgi:hypothetical protein